MWVVMYLISLANLPFSEMSAYFALTRTIFLRTGCINEHNTPGYVSNAGSISLIVIHFMNND